MNENNKNDIGILILGNANVGKTSFISRFVQNKFITTYSSTQELSPSFITTNIDIKGQKYKIKFLDSTAAEKYIPALKPYIQKIDCFIFMYDITNKKSFDDIEKWIKIVTDVKEKQNIAMILLGNKRDLKLERQIEEQDAEEFAKKMEVSFLETSNKDNNDDNIHLAVEKLVNDIEEKRKKFGFDQNLNSEKTRVSLNKEKKSKKKNFWYSCC